ncbi:MAG: TIGR03960 family B12-binding radical SAM protein [Candidatus Margulisiibacteriota bacterium]
MRELIEAILPTVLRPSRYIGNEINAVHKEWQDQLKVAIAYPDLYEIGMSNLAVQILYHILNARADVIAERVFAPWGDMEAALSANRLPLFSLESWKPLSGFNLIGFSLGYELNYTNVVNMLKLGRVPLHRTERGETDPLVFAGGPSLFNPEPVIDIFDFIVIGEAEEAIVEIIEKVKGTKGQGPVRNEILKALSTIEGVYVPGISRSVKKRHVNDLDAVPYPLSPIIPFTEPVHDRAVIEIMRGCKWGCKFCQAGWTTRPVREKKLETLIQQAEELVKNTGYEELSLISLSSSDHSQIEALAKELANRNEKRRVNIALPSMRTNSFSVKLAHQVARVRSSSITIAPEAGSQRLRDYIGKKMTEENIMESVQAVFASGIEAVKLYFMIGLPTETEEDLLGIGQLARKIFEVGRCHTRRVRVTVNLSTFIPKPHTPFQWERQITINETLQKQRLIKESIRQKFIDVRWHQAEASFLEGVFSRGDARLLPVIEKAWELGARLDAWSENFDFDRWLKAFADCGIDPAAYLRERNKDEDLPWDYIETGISKEMLANAANPN